MKKFLIIFIILIIFISKISVDGQILIPDEAIRLRVLANSNSIYDQHIKNEVSRNLQDEIYDILKNTSDINNARTHLNNNLERLNKNIKKTLNNQNYSLGYNLEFGLHYFPNKEYKGVTYKEGKYESLLVTLGKGEGNNWWCVLFPPLCLLEAEETIEDEIEYKSYVIELINKIFNK